MAKAPEKPKIYDQGQLGSSTACALSGVIEHELKKKKKKRKFIYFKERKL